jgi:hypothetical protein
MIICMYRIPYTSFGCEIEELLTVPSDLVDAPVSELDQMLSLCHYGRNYLKELKVSVS